MINLTTDLVRGAWDATLAAVVGVLQPQPYRRRIVSIAIIGPSNSTLRIYRGYGLANTTLVSNVFPADDRLYDSLTDDAPLIIHAGEAVTFAWTGGASAVGETGIATVNSQWG